MEDPKKKIALLSNITVDLLVAKLARKYDIYVPEGFDTWIQEVINPESRLYAESFDAVVVLLDGTEARNWKDISDALDRISMWKSAIKALYEKNNSIPILVSTIDIRENRVKALSERKFSYELENDWYQFIQEIGQNVYALDLKEIICDIGRENYYSNKMWYMSSMPFSRDGLNSVSRVIDRTLKTVFEIRKKIIVLDLDNTLWGGVVGEDGVEGIELSDHKEGQRYYDFQRQLLEMKKRGILLGINSKNNSEDALSAINGHPAMLLREDDFVAEKINWNNKAVNIKEMERELNLTEGGFVFIDDNPVERDTVKGECPEVYVPDFPEDTTELISFAEEIWRDYCRPLRVLDEDLKKTQMYQNEQKRKQDLSESLNIDDYIEKLEMKVDIHKMRDDEIERVTQLCNKTNQFNVTTKRYTRSEIEDIEADKNSVIYVVYASDKYGDSGLISVIILKNDASDTLIDSFLMSCRVMGRKLENVIINEIASRCDGERLIGEYIPTPKNVPVKELYDRLGFSLISDKDGRKDYEMILETFNKEDYRIYKEIKFED